MQKQSVFQPAVLYRVDTTIRHDENGEYKEAVRLGVYHDPKSLREAIQAIRFPFEPSYIWPLADVAAWPERKLLRRRRR